MTEISADPVDPVEKKNPEVFSDEDFDKQAKRDFISSAQSANHNKWRRDCDEDFEMVAGGAYDDSGQWRQDDIETLKDQGRPIITLNRIEPLVEGIVGAEVNNRQEVSYQARENDDKAIALALGEAGKWARDNDVEEEETEAFRNAIICGMGWPHHIMDYSEDLDGKYTVVSTDPLGHYWDIDSIKPNLTDARWVGYVELMSRDRFKMLFPGEKGKDSVFGIKPFPVNDDSRASKFNSDYDDPNLTDTGGTGAPGTNKGKAFAVLEYQCYKMEPVFRILDPNAGGELSEPMEKREFDVVRASVKAAGGLMARFGTPVDVPEETVIRFLKQEKRIYYRAFYTGNKRLEERERSPWRNGFTMQCITARRHMKRNTWYGVVRAMKDPQRLTNSFMSSMIHHHNSNPKGGMIYEEGAFDNPEDMESKMSHPAPAIEALAGGLAKIKMIDPTPPSSALAQMFSLVTDIAPMVTGISLEFLGLAGRDQAIGLEQTRKLSTLSIVSPVFSSYRKYRKQAGRLLFDFIKDFIPQTTLERILSKESKPHAKLLKNANTLKFDIHVDDAPLSPSMKATVFSVMKDMLQFLPPELAPSYLGDFLDYSPLPATLVQKLQQALQPKPPDPTIMIERMLELKKLEAESRKLDADADLTEAKTDTEEGKPQREDRKLDITEIDNLLNVAIAQLQQSSKGNDQ